MKLVYESEEYFKERDETTYLLSNPNNVKRLLESIEELNAGKVETHELIEV